MTRTLPRADTGWHPDPHRRHEHRWWDGRQWTAQVADHGVVSTDDVTTPPAGAAPGGRRRAAVAAVAAGAALVGALALVVVAATPPVTCTTSDDALEEELASGELLTRCIRVGAGQAVRFRVAPTGGQDVVLAVAADDAAADEDPRIEDLGPEVFTGDLEGAPGTDDLGTVVLVVDEWWEGEPEAAFVPPTRTDTELTLVVVGYEGASGGVTVDIELLDPPPGFDPEQYPDADAFEAEFVGTAEFEAHYGPFFEGDFFP